MNKMDFAFRQQIAKRVYTVAEGIVPPDMVTTLVNDFTAKNADLPLVRYKKDISVFLAEKFNGFFKYHDFSIDLNNLSDEILDALRGDKDGIAIN
jgi:hypothetical protein